MDQAIKILHLNTVTVRGPVGFKSHIGFYGFYIGFYKSHIGFFLPNDLSIIYGVLENKISARRK